MNVITQPFMATINKWIFHGELSDVLGEFFISENLACTDLWINKYKLEMA